MLNYLDNWLNKITMYRLVYYYLIALILAAIGLGAFKILRFSPLDIIISTAVLTVVSLSANWLFAKVYNVPANVESDYITAWILVLIITPSASLSALPFFVAAAILAQASKYIIAWRGKHLFNPAALAVLITSLTLHQTASWWVATAWMFPFVLVGGLLLVRKIQRFDLVISFLVVSLGTILATSLSYSDPGSIIRRAFLDAPLAFFALLMLTEPMTTPPTRNLRIIYGALVGLLFAPRIHLGPIYTTPEMALVIGNIFVYFVSPKMKLLLTLKAKKEMGKDTMDFTFTPNHKMPFKPGQYLEWTLGHQTPDSRGNRRYFTIASSPTEQDLHLGVKFYPNASSFKKSLMSLKVGDKILAGQLAGDFTLPADKNRKLVFIAGGIGITPFRSMLKYLIDNDEKRPITLFYSNYTQNEVSYREVLDEAREKLGIKTVLVMTDTQGRLNREVIEREVPVFKDQTYYISGSHSMVVAFEKTLLDMGVARTQIKIDFFPGFV